MNSDISFNEPNIYRGPNKDEEEKSFFCFNDSNSLNDYSLDSFNSSEIYSLYFLEKQIKDNNIDSLNLIRNNDKKKIKFKTEIYQLNNLLNKKIKREDYLENSNSKEEKMPKHIKKTKKANKKKTHTASDDDNILRKIQVHYISFIISLSNDIVSSLVNDKNVPRFEYIDYKQKKIVNHEFVESLKKKKIEEVVKFKISPKIKKNEFINGNIYKSVLERCPIIQKFFERTYLSLFEEYYKTKDNIFMFNEKVVLLSDETKKKTFGKLIEKYPCDKEKIKYVCINYYFNSYKRIKKPSFKIRSFKKSNQNKKIK